MLKGTNFIELKTGISWENAFMVIDTPNEIGVRLIDDIHIAARYKVYANNKQQYKVVLYKFKAKHRDEFLEAIAEISNKALVCGYTDYEYFCNEFINEILKSKRKK